MTNEQLNELCNEVGTPINDRYKIGDAVFLQHRIGKKVVISIGFLVYTANRDETILARTIHPLSDFIIIPDDEFICLGHMEYLERLY